MDFRERSLRWQLDPGFWDIESKMERLSLRIEHQRLSGKKGHHDKNGTRDCSTHELTPPKGGVFLCE
jgi:hypothetical protein